MTAKRKTRTPPRAELLELQAAAAVRAGTLPLTPRERLERIREGLIPFVRDGSAATISPEDVLIHVDAILAQLPYPTTLEA